MRLVVVVIASTFWAGCPTTRNPTYCELPEHCPGQTCDLTSHTCVDTPDGTWSVDASIDADNDVCEQAGGRLVWVSDRDGDTEIVSAYADGSEVRLLTTNTFADARPRVSPDGRKIAWLSSPNGVTELFVMDIDGSNPVNVSSQGEGAPISDDPAWSADGRLAFASERDGASDIYVVEPDGSGFLRLTSNGDASGPTWSPDGEYIAFYRYVDDNGDVYRINVDGDVHTTSRLTTNPEYDGVPKWSPGGASIAYVSQQPTYREIWTMTTSGASEQVLVPAAPSIIYLFEWSLDGSRITFQWEGDINTVDADGTNRVNLNESEDSDGDPFWNPSADRIVIVSDRQGNDEIYTMRDNGLEIANVSNDGGNDTDPSWTGCP